MAHFLDFWCFDVKTYRERIAEKLKDELNTECSICMKEVSWLKMALTNCGHWFCHSCLKISLMLRSYCPQCRALVFILNGRRTFVEDIYWKEFDKISIKLDDHQYARTIKEIDRVELKPRRIKFICKFPEHSRIPALCFSVDEIHFKRLPNSVQALLDFAEKHPVKWSELQRESRFKNYTDRLFSDNQVNHPKPRG